MLRILTLSLALLFASCGSDNSINDPVPVVPPPGGGGGGGGAGGAGAGSPYGGDAQDFINELNTNATPLVLGQEITYDEYSSEKDLGVRCNYRNRFTKRIAGFLNGRVIINTSETSTSLNPNRAGCFTNSNYYKNNQKTHSLRTWKRRMIRNIRLDIDPEFYCDEKDYCHSYRTISITQTTYQDSSTGLQVPALVFENEIMKTKKKGINMKVYVSRRSPFEGVIRVEKTVINPGRTQNTQRQNKMQLQKVLIQSNIQ